VTRQQLTGIGILSVLVTILVLMSALHSPGSASAQAEIQRQLALVNAGVVVASTPAATTPAVAADDDSGDDAAATDDTTTDAAATDDTDPVATKSSTESEDDGGTGGSGGTGADATTPTTPVVPPATNLKHVFVITLKGQGFDAAFGAGSAAPYLANQLRPKGTLLTNFSSLGKSDLADRLAFIGGQPPNAATKANCTTYSEIGTAEPSSTGQITKDGCVYPNTVISLADQFNIGHKNWRGYSEDMEKGPRGDVKCRRPDSDGPDATQDPRPGDNYAARNNPFIYFHSLLDLSGCDTDSGSFGPLASDLQTAKATPNLVYIAPSLQHDGSVVAPADGSPGGIAAADAFLQTWVPKILDSPAYQADGLLIITFAGGPGPADEPTKNGTLLISRFAKAGGTDDTALNPYSLTATVEDLIGVKRIANAVGAPSLAGTVLSSAQVVVPGSD
jgi:hypothetical protein